jgi:hypothetical protein
MVLCAAGYVCGARSRGRRDGSASHWCCMACRPVARPCHVALLPEKLPQYLHHQPVILGLG